MSAMSRTRPWLTFTGGAISHPCGRMYSSKNWALWTPWTAQQTTYTSGKECEQTATIGNIYESIKWGKNQDALTKGLWASAIPKTAMLIWRLRWWRLPMREWLKARGWHGMGSFHYAKRKHKWWIMYFIIAGTPNGYARKDLKQWRT